jgi:phosphatidylinositol glycan class B
VNTLAFHCFMLKQIIKPVCADRKLQLILTTGLVVQILFAVTATGFYHPDQHFSIVEFSSYQSGEQHAADKVWEFRNPVRPTLQVYVFTVWHWLMKMAGISNPYLEMTLLRIVLSLFQFIVFNLVLLHFLKDEQKKTVHLSALILNFSWFLPYCRTLFNSEMVSSVFFFGTVLLFDLKRKQNPGFVFLMLIGFLFALSFYFRFQTGFFLAGFGLWMLITKQPFRFFSGMAAGFITGCFINIALDYGFYGHWVLTPYEYFHANIVAGRAASFGTDSVLKYIFTFIALLTVPPLSLLLLFYLIKSLAVHWKHVLFLSVVVFFIGHSLVGHKEERFMFPVLSVLPVMAGWGIPALSAYLKRTKKIIRFLFRFFIYFSAILNLLLLILLMLNPYSQNIRFTSKLYRYFEDGKRQASLYCLNRIPFETESGVPLVYYSRAFHHLQVTRIGAETVSNLPADAEYVATTYDQGVRAMPALDSLGFKPVLYSSRLLWQINTFLYSHRIHTINEIWVLLKREKRIP